MTDKRETEKEFLEHVLESITYMPCVFWACDGPDVPFVDMATCALCRTIQDIRERLELIK